MDKDTREAVIRSLLSMVKAKMFLKKDAGLIISEEIMNEILLEIEDELFGDYE